jgi:hypothetical protein
MDKNKVKQSDWYIGKYGTQSEVTESETTGVKVPELYGTNMSEATTQSVESTFRTYLTEKLGLTLKEQVVAPEVTTREREVRVKPEGKGLTASFSGTNTDQPLPFQQKFINRVDNDPFESKSKKFFVKIVDNAPQLDATDFQDFVATIIKLPKQDATNMIKSKKVTVNNLVVTDLNYVLKSGDVVRAGLVGHFINNPEGIAIVN